MTTAAKAKYFAQQTGFAYIAVLFLVVAISVSLAIVSQDEATIQMREKERDWLYIGQQYQQAIKSYYEKSPDGIKVLPMSVADLVLDSRYVAPIHHLRKAYIDPITGKDWALIRNEEGFLIGVYSESTYPVLLQQSVAQVIESSEAISQHTDVKFIAKIEAETQDEQNDSGDQQGDEDFPVGESDVLQEADSI